MLAQAGRWRTGRGLTAAWAAVPLGVLVFALTVAGLVAVVAAGQSEGQLLRLAGVLLAGPFGALVATRRPRLLVGWLILGMGLFLSVGDGASAYAQLDYRLRHGQLPLGPLAVALIPSFILGLVLVTFALWLFPDGGLLSGRWRRVGRSLSAAGLAYGLVVYVPWVIAALSRPLRLDADGTPAAITHGAAGLIWRAAIWGIVALVLSWAVWIAVQVPRYRRSSGERRQQLKWLYSGAVVFAVSATLTVLPVSGPLGSGIATALAAAGLSAFPAAQVIGILKFRLYDIDKIISRTLSYTLVTGLIVGVYAGLVLLATHVLAFSGPVGVAGSTLIAAVLFNPLRKRIQRGVDRRFNRAHVDAEATVTAFASRLRESVDLPSVQQALVTAVDQAFEPAHVSVWLADSSPGRR